MCTAIYGSLVYLVTYVMLLMRANQLQGQVGGGWALEIEIYLSPVKWYQAVRRVSFGAQKLQDFQSLTPFHLPM